MTPRERFRETLLFGKPDKVPFDPGHARESTLKAWHEQGLPEGRDYIDVLHETLGIEKPKTKPVVHHGVSDKMMPMFEEKVLEHKDGHYIVQDWMGAITEISDEYDYTYIRQAIDFVTRKWHKFPVENREDWEKMKWRFDAKTPGRFSEDFADRCDQLRERDYVSTLTFNGPFWQLREWCGMEGLCIFMATDPDFVMEMVDFWKDYLSDILTIAFDGFVPDSVLINEDMAYKAHSMISPAMTRKFLLPSYKQWADQIESAGCPVFEVDSDGFIGELIPIWIDAGFNSCLPIEVAAHNDIVEFRKTFGKKMAYRGGIDKRAMAKGGEVVEKEMMRVIPPLLKDGGFIPSCDHGVPPDISWPNFIEYSRRLAQLTGWL